MMAVEDAGTDKSVCATCFWPLGLHRSWNRSGSCQEQ